MTSRNLVILIGRLGHDPDVRYLQNGDAVSSFSIATSEEWKDKNTGEKKERTEWHQILAFRRLGEICGEYLTKGSQVYIEGKLQTQKYEKDGITRYSTKVFASTVQFLGGGSGDGGGNRNQLSNRSQYDDGGYPEPPPMYSSDDDIPF